MHERLTEFAFIKFPHLTGFSCTEAAIRMEGSLPKAGTGEANRRIAGKRGLHKKSHLLKIQLQAPRSYSKWPSFWIKKAIRPSNWVRPRPVPVKSLGFAEI
jgi:hypothetical protein